MRNVSNNYIPVSAVDPDALGRANAALYPISQTELAVADEEQIEDTLPSYDESNRMNPVTVVR